MPDPVITQGTTGQTARDLLALDYKQNAVPSSPSAGDRWLRIDDATGAAIEPEAGAWWERDTTNSYWLSEKVYTTNIFFKNFSATESIFPDFQIALHDIYLIYASTRWFQVLGTFNSTNYWKASIGYRSSNNATTTFMYTVNQWSSGRTVGNWYRNLAQGINQHLDTSAVDFGSGILSVYPQGSPGTLNGGEAVFKYRIARV